MGKFIDLTGKIFGRLKIIKLDHMNKEAYWLCRCNCNKQSEIIVRGSSLRNKNTTSCGCLQKEVVGKTSFKNIKGKRFGRLVVIELDHIDKHAYWLCQCDCDNKKLIVNGHSIRRGKTKSCGCLRKEIITQGKYKDNNKLRKLKRLESIFKKNAKRRSGRTLEYSLTLEQIEKLSFSNCFYCGKEPSNIAYTAKHEQIKYSGLDRTDSSKGYIISNVVPCCIECNQSKNDQTLEDFKSWIERVYNHFVKGNDETQRN